MAISVLQRIEIVCAKGNQIELLRPDDTGKLISVCVTPVFAVVRSWLAFRLAGSNKDYLVIGSDSGKYLYVNTILPLTIGKSFIVKYLVKLDVDVLYRSIFSSRSKR